MEENKHRVIGLVANLVAAYVSNNSISAADLPNLIASINGAMNDIESETSTRGATPLRREPAVPLKKAVQPDHVVDLFTGRKFKSLKRHLRTTHNMSPEQYREYWGLPRNSPMVAPNYAAARSTLAKESGLGRGGRNGRKTTV